MNTTETNTQTTQSNGFPSWGAYKADGTLEALLNSESEAYYYIKNRGHMYGGSYRACNIQSDLLAALQILDINLRILAEAKELRTDTLQSTLQLLRRESSEAIAKATQSNP